MIQFSLIVSPFCRCERNLSSNAAGNFSLIYSNCGIGLCNLKLVYITNNNDHNYRNGEVLPDDKGNIDIVQGLGLLLVHVGQGRDPSCYIKVVFLAHCFIWVDRRVTCLAEISAKRARILARRDDNYPM